ncbi:cytochrome b/b6 domain-containing protein [Terricaulis sp.]|uniref:cytochrome b/b6 domain-containing protein n=1 Tax=Terricaulis sp. TaxID=2768686 RepID=UPI00378309E5
MSTANLSQPGSIKVWDGGVRLFHWLLVIVVAVAFLSSEEESALNLWHIPAGWLAAVLIAFRLVWGFVGGEHARFWNFIRPAGIGAHVAGLLAGRAHASAGHNPLGALAVLGLLGLLAGTILTGIAGGEDGHETIAYALLALVAVHVAAVVAMSLLTRDNLVRAMVTGRKRADRLPGVRDARPPLPLALPLAALAVAATAYLAVRIDPLAFTPHATESGEHESEAWEDDD